MKAKFKVVIPSIGIEFEPYSIYHEMGIGLTPDRLDELLPNDCNFDGEGINKWNEDEQCDLPVDEIIIEGIEDFIWITNGYQLFISLDPLNLIWQEIEL